MIYFIDNFLSKQVLENTVKDLNSKSYQEFKTPGKSFYVQQVNSEFMRLVAESLSKAEGNRVDPILGFFRVSNEELDNEWRIHSDLKIEGQQPDRALVLYISPRVLSSLHGTALWEHKIYGRSLPDNTSNEEFNRLISSESENLDMWTLDTVIGYRQNRAISYPASYFHSKYPNKSWQSGREVFVMFYKITNN
jgi:hypothetical protein